MSKINSILESLAFIRESVEDQVDALVDKAVSKYPALSKVGFKAYEDDGDIEFFLGGKTNIIRFVLKKKDAKSILSSQDVDKLLDLFKQHLKIIYLDKADTKKIPVIKKFYEATGEKLDIAVLDTKTPTKTRLSSYGAVRKFIDKTYGVVEDFHNNGYTVNWKKSPIDFKKDLLQKIQSAGYPDAVIEKSNNHGVYFKATKSIGIEIVVMKSDSPNCVDVEVYEVH